MKIAFCVRTHGKAKRKVGQQQFVSQTGLNKYVSIDEKWQKKQTTMSLNAWEP